MMSQKDKETKSQRVEETKSQRVEETKSQKDKETKSQRVEETKSQRDKETKSQRDKETKSRRDKETKSQRDKETKSQRVEETKSQRVEETKSQRDKETKRQRVEETKSQRVEETKSQRDKETKRQRVEETVTEVSKPAKLHRAYSPREIVRKTYKTLPFTGRWQEAFGLPEERATWFVGGASASGKSSFVMQLAYELTNYGRVLYLSYEEGLNQSFQERVVRFGLDRRQGSFRVATTDTMEDLKARLRKKHSAKFIIVDSIQMTRWEYRQTEDLVREFPRKSFIFVSQWEKGQPAGKPARAVRYLADVKVVVRGFRAYCQGRFNPDAGNSFVVWEEGVIRTTNNVP